MDNQQGMTSEEYRKVAIEAFNLGYAMGFEAGQDVEEDLEN